MSRRRARRKDRVFNEAGGAPDLAKNEAGGAPDLAKKHDRASGAKAVVATARKIAERFYRLLTKGGDYVRQQMNAYEHSYQLKLTRSLAKRASELGYRLVPVALAP